MRSTKRVLLFAFFLTGLLVLSCGKRKRATKSAKTTENKTVEIKQGSENQAYEDSVKRVKNELKNSPDPDSYRD